MGLFSVSGKECAALVPSTFADKHVELDIQIWADRCPALINEGKPMLALGMEIATNYNQYIDNLFIDGNGTLVVGEMKRGKSPRDVIAQTMQYGSYVSRLDWDAIEKFCQKTHGRSLDDAYAGIFGRPLPRPPKPQHRLLIVAESFDPQVFDDALYGINHGIPLSLIQFKTFCVGNAEIVDTVTVLGEIPDQMPPNRPASSAAPKPTPVKQSDDTTVPTADNGYAAWLLSTLADKLVETAQQRGWNLRHKVNTQSLPFADEAWPLSFGDCQLRADCYKSGVVSLRLHFRTDAAPDLGAFLEGNRARWADSYAGTLSVPAYPSPNTVYTLELPRPAMGDQAAVAEVFAKVEAMTAVFLPLLTEFFASTKATV